MKLLSFVSFILFLCLFSACRGPQGNATGYGGGSPERLLAVEYLKHLRHGAEQILIADRLEWLCRYPAGETILNVEPADLDIFQNRTSDDVEYCVAYLRAAALSIREFLDRDLYSVFSFVSNQPDPNNPDKRPGLYDEQGNYVSANTSISPLGLIYLVIEDFRRATPLQRIATLAHEILHKAPPKIKGEARGYEIPDTHTGDFVPLGPHSQSRDFFNYGGYSLGLYSFVVAEFSPICPAVSGDYVFYSDYVNPNNPTKAMFHRMGSSLASCGKAWEAFPGIRNHISYGPYENFPIGWAKVTFEVALGPGELEEGKKIGLLDASRWTRDQNGDPEFDHLVYQILTPESFNKRNYLQSFTQYLPIESNVDNYEFRVHSEGTAHLIFHSAAIKHRKCGNVRPDVAVMKQVNWDILQRAMPTSAQNHWEREIAQGRQTLSKFITLLTYSDEHRNLFINEWHEFFRGSLPNSTNLANLRQIAKDHGMLGALGHIVYRHYLDGGYHPETPSREDAVEFLRALYPKVVGGWYEPDQTRLNYWATELQNNALAAMVEFVRRERRFTDKVVVQLFDRFLDRRPLDDALDYWNNAFQNNIPAHPRRYAYEILIEQLTEEEYKQNVFRKEFESCSK